MNRYGRLGGGGVVGSRGLPAAEVPPSRTMLRRIARLLEQRREIEDKPREIEAKSREIEAAAKTPLTRAETIALEKEKAADVLQWRIKQRKGDLDAIELIQKQAADVLQWRIECLQGDPDHAFGTATRADVAARLASLEGEKLALERALRTLEQQMAERLLLRPDVRLAAIHRHGRAAVMGAEAERAAAKFAEPKP